MSLVESAGHLGAAFRVARSARSVPIQCRCRRIGRLVVRVHAGFFVCDFCRFSAGPRFAPARITCLPMRASALMKPNTDHYVAAPSTPLLCSSASSSKSFCVPWTPQALLPLRIETCLDSAPLVQLAVHRPLHGSSSFSLWPGTLRFLATADRPKMPGNGYCIALRAAQSEAAMAQRKLVGSQVPYFRHQHSIESLKKPTAASVDEAR